MRREIGLLLKAGKPQSARVRVEHVIREDFLIEALELLHLYADMLLARFGLVTTQRELDAGISEAVYVLVYAAPRVDVVELAAIRDQLISKYGKDLLDNTNNHAKDFVNPRIIHKLSISTPDPKLVTEYLKTIAEAYGVTWNDEIDLMESKPPGPPGVMDDFDFVAPSAPVTLIKPRDSLNPSAPIRPSVQSGSSEETAAGNNHGDNEKEPDFEALSKRFESLRKK